MVQEYQRDVSVTKPIFEEIGISSGGIRGFVINRVCAIDI
jgi:hypothetical protein